MLGPREGYLEHAGCADESIFAPSLLQCTNQLAESFE
jgi:hypothetical protein